VHGCEFSYFHFTASPAMETWVFHCSWMDLTIIFFKLFLPIFLIPLTLGLPLWEYGCIWQYADLWSIHFCLPFCPCASWSGLISAVLFSRSPIFSSTFSILPLKLLVSFFFFVVCLSFVFLFHIYYCCLCSEFLFDSVVYLLWGKFSLWNHAGLPQNPWSSCFSLRVLGL